MSEHTPSVARTPSDRGRSLVVVFLRGGADGLSMVPPVGLDAYHRARPTLRVRAEGTLPIDARFALAAELAPLERHLREGRLAIVHGAGSQDTTRSHFEAQDFMEHGGHSGGGWLARYLRARGAASGALTAVAIGTMQPESLRGAPGAAVIRTVRDVTMDDADRRLLGRLERLYAAQGGPLAEAATQTLLAVDSLRALHHGAGTSPEGSEYPATAFGRGLREIAHLIKADLGMAAATIDMIGGGLGWDTHFVQAQAMPGLLRELGQGVDAFWRDLGSHRSSTTVVIMTEFGRRLAENSSLGTDHGAGSVMFVLDEDLPGVAAAGQGPSPIAIGGVHADWRGLGADELVGPGDVPVTTDYRSVLARVLRHAAPEVDVTRVFPGWREV
jgi:uncharacterized protein (DUF1501 family)